ncbi:GAF sensor signal transduction histidine kinase (plasmid) [Deinococcus proteolyticus MRP]|uniref:histidine kinase n=2 Tax=Deinococcus proteolyticus TaxID=55148 RepID=F0RPN8_DEIPM|nr:GAF sensor signal transduction histidine kinase [Deinococcus proteolyticus MRP]
MLKVMTASAPGASPRPPSLTEHLQDVTERLAAARTQEEVFQTVLRPALEGVDAIAGAVLLVDAAGERLELAATQDYEEGAQTIWQAGPLTGNVPAGDALQRGEALFFEEQGELVRTYPALEERSGAVAPVANAVLPMFLDHRPLGTLILDFREPHHFTREERRFLMTLAAQCAIALGRARLMADLQGQLAERTRQIEQEARAHAAFVAFAEAAGTENDVAVLVRQALQLLSHHFPGGAGAYCVREDGRWVGQGWSATLPPELVSTLTAGLDAGFPLLDRMQREKSTVFCDDWSPDDRHIPGTEGYRMIFCSPLTLEGEIHAFLSFARRQAHGPQGWSAQDRTLVRAIGRSLELALERAQQAARLQARRQEAERRSEMLATFAELSRDLVLDTDPYSLIRRTQEVALDLLPAAFSAYFELQGGVWQARTQAGADPDGATDELGAGQPFGAAPHLSGPYQSGEPTYQQEPGPGGRSSVSLPVAVNGQVRGVLTFVLAGPQPWNEEDRAILETVGHQLRLALERAEQTQRLHEQNGELEAFTYSVSHDLRTPVRHIMGFNRLLRGNLGTEIDAKSERYLTVIDDATVRMNTLIDAMLDLSRTARATLKMGPVDLGSLVAEVRSELEAEEEDRAVVWEVAPLPQVTGDRATLHQAAVNLLSNALKYTRTREEAHIRVWAEERPYEWAVFVRDNGVGFDPHYSERLFGVFQRLHRADEFEGTGVGLANVRRIVARHGGTVSAESRLGEGATFGFTLPKQS